MNTNKSNRGQKDWTRWWERRRHVLCSCSLPNVTHVSNCVKFNSWLEQIACRSIQLFASEIIIFTASFDTFHIVLAGSCFKVSNIFDPIPVIPEVLWLSFCVCVFEVRVELEIDCDSKVRRVEWEGGREEELPPRKEGKRREGRKKER